MVKKIAADAGETLSSSGHRIGQIIGDWWETKVIFPLLQEVATELKLYLDNREVKRSCRGEKVQWPDADGNLVDYDYVLELGGSAKSKGIPVAFIESFWRRGARHSKDKARDDTNKLLPMRDAYPTSRFLAIAACGEFTEPAREYVRSRSVELFCISKKNIIEAFNAVDIQIDYPDKLPESKKDLLVKDLEAKFTPKNQRKASKRLRELAGAAAFNAFKQIIKGSLTAPPQEIRICSVSKSLPVIFETIQQAQAFLIGQAPQFPIGDGLSQYDYQVTFSDGSEFSRTLDTLNDVKTVNDQLLELVNHISSLQ